MLTEINSMLSSSDPTNVKLGVTLLESLYPTEYTTLAAEWQPWADVFGTTVADTIAINGLEKIDCRCMKLRSIPALPKTVIQFYCSNNQLTALPAMPNVRELYCSNNQLPALPDLPNVQMLRCSDNRLSELPALPNVQVLIVRDNRLKNRRAILELYPFAQM